MLKEVEQFDKSYEKDKIDIIVIMIKVN